MALSIVMSSVSTAAAQQSSRSIQFNTNVNLTDVFRDIYDDYVRRNFTHSETISVNVQRIYNECVGLEEEKRSFFCYGRDKEIKDLYSLLEDNEIVVIKGRSGIGKTTLARLFVSTFKKKSVFLDSIFNAQSKDNIILWIDATNVGTLTASVHRFAKYFDVSVEDRYIFIVFEEILFRCFKTRGGFIVFDNVKSKNLLINFMPREHIEDVKVLITSKNDAWNGTNCMQLASLSENSSIATLVTELGLNSKYIQKLGQVLQNVPRYLNRASLIIKHQITNENNYEALKEYLNAVVAKRKTLLGDSDFSSLKGPSNIPEYDIDSLSEDGYSQLHVAAKNGHWLTVQMLIKNKANSNLLTKQGLTALHLAADGGHWLTVHELIKGQTHIDRRSRGGYTPLHVAAESGHWLVVWELLDNDANINCKTINGSTALHLAAAKGHRRAVFELLHYNADVDARTNDNQTPLHLAAESGHWRVIRQLINEKADINSKSNGDYTPLHMAAAAGHWKAVSALTGNLASSNITNDDARVLREGDPAEYLSILLKGQINIDVKSRNGETPMHLAAANGHRKVVSTLLARKGDLNSRTNDGSTPLHLAVANGYPLTIRELVDNGANIYTPTFDGRTALHIAAANGHWMIVQDLLKEDSYSYMHVILDNAYFYMLVALAYLKLRKNFPKRSYANSATDKGLTPIHMAAARGHCKVINVLIKVKVEVNILAIYNKTPLHLAAENGHWLAVRDLIAANADVNVRTIEGDTPLHLAARGGHWLSILELIKGKANINSQSNDDESPIHYAIYSGAFISVLLLIRSGANIGLVSSTGFPPVDLALSLGHQEIAKLLIVNGAQTTIDRTAKYGQKDVLDLLINMSIFGNADISIREGDEPLGDIEVTKRCFSYELPKLLRARQDANQSVNVNELIDCINKVIIIKNNEIGSLKQNIYFNNKMIHGQKKHGNFTFQMNKSIDLFVGRKEEIYKLYKLLETTKLVVVCGLSGVGKTEFAKQFAWTCFENGIYEYVIWMNAENQVTLKDSILKLARKIKLEFGPESEISYDDLLQDIYDTFSEKDGLFIFDGVDNLKDFRNFFPSRKFDHSNLFIILTSSTSIWGRLKLFHLNVMSKEESIDLVKSELTDTNFDQNDSKDIEKLVTVLQNLPLALQQATTFIKYKRQFEGVKYPIKKYVKNLEKLLLNPDISSPFDDSCISYDKTVYKTILMSVEKLKKWNPDELNDLAVEILNSAVFLFSENIQKTIFMPLKAITGTEIIEEIEEKQETVYAAIARLKRFCIVSEMRYTQREMEFGTEQSSIFIHKLVQKALQVYLKNENQYNHSLVKAFDLVLNEEFMITEHFVAVLKHFSSEFLNNLFIDNCNSSKKRNMLLHSLLYHSFFNLLNNLLITINDSTILLNAYGKITVQRLEDKSNDENGHPENRIWTLYLAAKNCHFPIVHTLIEKGMDVNDLSSLGWSPFHAAACNASLDTVKMLKSAGGFNEIETQCGVTPLQLAVCLGQHDIVEYLISEGASVHNVDMEGDTPLHDAFRLSHIGIASLLLENGADADVRNKRGQTPISLLYS